MSFFIVACFFPVLLVVLLKWRHTYWKRRGVGQLKPEFFFGDLRDMLTSKISVGGAFKDIYFTFKKKNLPYGGAYLSYKPQFIPVDPQLIKDIMQKNFDCFQDRGLYFHENDVLTTNMFRIEGAPWKQLRVKLTPTFTSSRIKMMFETVVEKVDCLQSVTAEYAREGQINVTDICGRFTTDVIGSCAFGIECDSLRHPDCDFRVYGKKITQPHPLKQWLENVFPKRLLGFTGYKSFPDCEKFYTNIIKATIQNREENEIFRKDFMHLLLQLRNRGVLSDDGKVNKDKNEMGILTDEEILAQCFIFFAAGFDTSASTMAYALYELAKNPDVQDKMRSEIRQVLEKYDGKLTYEGAKEMVYTEKVVLETLRKYPILPSIPRVCTKEYKIPNSNVIINKGTAVQISVWGLQMDPEFYPDPEIFDPERFSDEEKAKRPLFTYLPFGEGPRICIGARFAMMQTKLGLVGLVKDYKFSLLKDVAEKLSFKSTLILLHTTEDIQLKIEKA